MSFWDKISSVFKPYGPAVSESKTTIVDNSIFGVIVEKSIVEDGMVIGG